MTKPGIRSFLARVRRVFVVLLGIAIVCGSALWWARDRIANAVLDKALTKFEQKAQKAGLQFLDVQSDPIHIPTPLRATLTNVRAEFDVAPPNRNQMHSRFRAEKVEMTVAGVFPPKARFHLENFSLQFHPDDLPPDFPFEVFHEGRLSSSPLPVSHPSSALKQIFQRFRELYGKNQVVADFDFSGVVTVKVGDHSVKTRLYTEKLPGGARRLRFSEKDLRCLADSSGLGVSDALVHIASLYPLRAPMVFAITWAAKQESIARKKANPSFPEDAFRHVVWSYNLTKTFGPEFAKMVTDAHETLPGNTPDERAMDYHNNAVARALARQGVPANQLLRLILADPRIIRHPQEVKNHKELLR